MNLSIRSLAVGLVLSAHLAMGQAEAVRLFEGRWITEDRNGVYAVSGCPVGLCGTIVGVKPHLNSKGKPDATCGVRVLTLTKWNAQRKRWEGKVLDPESNKTYGASLEISKEGSPVMRASWSVFQYSDKWSRFNGSIGGQCEIK